MFKKVLGIVFLICIFMIPMSFVASNDSIAVLDDEDEGAVSESSVMMDTSHTEPIWQVGPQVSDDYVPEVIIVNPNETTYNASNIGNIDSEDASDNTTNVSQEDLESTNNTLNDSTADVNSIYDSSSQELVAHAESNTSPSSTNSDAGNTSNVSMQSTGIPIAMLLAALLFSVVGLKRKE